MQRLAILEYLDGTKSHPTAEEIYEAVHETYPTIARATVYNTLEALTKSGTILQLTVDPTAARYDADTGPHVHFRCRICGRVYDINAKQSRCLASEVDNHQVESIRTYAFGVCASCRKKEASEAQTRSPKEKSPKSRRSADKGTSENDPKGRSHKASDSIRGRRPPIA